MNNRTRNNQIKIYIDDKEKEIFETKKQLARCKTMNHFIRKCVLEKEIFIVDLEPFRDLQYLLANATNNINQIAKHINTFGVIYKNDIDEIKKELNFFSVELWKLHSLLTKHIEDRNK